MDSTNYNYAIIGAGCSGIHLALAMLEDDHFSDKSILILEKDSKSVNDRTWCFWEEGAGKWDAIIDHSWEKGKYYSARTDKALTMQGYRYKKLNAIDFYSFAKSKIQKAPNIHWVQDSVKEVQVNGIAKILGEQDNYVAQHIFDSRINPEFNNTQDKFIRILQHFKGWIIETEEDVFRPDEFIIMDFRLQWKNSTSFSYLLPTSPRRALVEFTLFTTTLIEDKDYDQMLQQYLNEVLHVGPYKILEEEKGVIPMSDFPFHRYHQKHLTKIGTAGSWVRPSTGYSFKNSEKYSQQILQNIKSGRVPSSGIGINRHRHYDKLLLKILHDRNELGESLFTSMFERNPTVQIFKFLDEETTILEDLRIMSSFRSAPFLEALYKRVFT